MSLRVHSRRLARQACTSQPHVFALLLRPLLPSPSTSSSPALSQTRHKSQNRSGTGKPTDEGYESRKAYMDMLKPRLDSPSIFDEDLANSPVQPAGVAADGSLATPESGGKGRAKFPVPSRAADPTSPLYPQTQRKLDPDPSSHARWLRRRVVEMVRARHPSLKGHVHQVPVEPRKAAERRERHLLFSSPALATSRKKLGMLARQVAGKDVGEAVLQMKFSKKKMAREVKLVLQDARDRAIVSAGMGLGKVKAKTATEGEAGSESASAVPAKPPQIQLKNGTWLDVQDPSSMYVSQAWVGSAGWRGRRFNFHGRGRRSVMRRPLTKIWVLLKEEKTRIREFQEREAKKAASTPWVHLPNRKVTAQRSYYCW